MNLTLDRALKVSKSDIYRKLSDVTLERCWTLVSEASIEKPSKKLAQKFSEYDNEMKARGLID